MNQWNPNAYLQFANERNLPAQDLVQKISLQNPSRILDIGCGPGNSTRQLYTRWPKAEVWGLDSSQAMIEAARAKAEAPVHWICRDASVGIEDLGEFTLIFSNAAIQWIPQQETLLPRLFQSLEQGGVLAVQVPDCTHMPFEVCLTELAASKPWAERFRSVEKHANHDAYYYYEVMSPFTDSLSLWKTTYIHELQDHQSLGQWFRQSALLPYLRCLHSEEEKEKFVAEIIVSLQSKYPLQSNGKVLLPFDRVFFVAVRE